MRTDELIDRLAADLAPVRAGGPPRRLAAAALVGGAGALALVSAWMHVRPDLTAAVATWNFWMKAGYAVVLAAAGFLMAERLGRPAGSGRRGVALALAAAGVLILLGLIQLATAAPGDRLALWLGQSWRYCPFNILALSGPALVASFLALRTLAPTRLVGAGAAAGLLAGGLAMAAYALHCPETEPAFVATWYSLGALLTALLGALLGPLLLRWR